MKIGLIDVDNNEKLNKCFPNIALMKLSQYHISRGDDVGWYDPLLGGYYDRVYMSKVFSFTKDYKYPINADEIFRGGTGYHIKVDGQKEVFDEVGHKNLPDVVENMFPDYSLYGITDTAYGFCSRGCVRNCDFCHVCQKEGYKSYKVADLSSFWNGQKYIELMDPNTLACKDWKDILQQLIDSKAKVNFNQGLDIRMMTDEKAEMISRCKIKGIHFAYDRIEDAPIIEPKFEIFRSQSTINPHNLQVYVLCGDRERRVLPEDLHRIYWLREHGFAPYVMLYNKHELPRGHELKKLQRWVNNRFIFWSTPTFEEYLKVKN